MAHRLTDQSWSEVSIQLKETVIDRVISHDLRASDKGRVPDGGLLAEVFRLGCRYVGQTPSPQLLAAEVRSTLGASVGTDRIRHYLRLLDMSLLLRCVPPAELRLKRNRGPSKICLVDHALRACWLQEVVPLVPAELHDEALCTLAGHIAESAVGSICCIFRASPSRISRLGPTLPRLILCSLSAPSGFRSRSSTGEGSMRLEILWDFSLSWAPPPTTPRSGYL